MKLIFQNIVSWIKTNKIATLLIVIVILFLGKRDVVPLLSQSSEMSYRGVVGSSGSNYGNMDLVAPMGAKSMAPIPINDSYAPVESQNRMVVRTTNMSMVVKDVATTVNEMITSVQTLGGFLISSNISKPIEGGTGTVTVRVPVDKLDQVLEIFRAKSIRVIDENVTGSDVTDQYANLDERLRILNQTKTKFEDLNSQAKEISDLLNLQRELLSVQSQIDSIVGQQKYLSQTAKLALVSVYLSTDELSLPYAPNEPWRPQVIVRYAYRSLLGNIQKLGSLAIWIAVYSVIWIPLLLIIFVIKKKLRKSSIS
jgi:hypothetical protein